MLAFSGSRARAAEAVPPARTRIEVRFLADRTCDVAIADASGSIRVQPDRTRVRLPPSLTLRRTSQPDRRNGDFECALPSLARGAAVDLSVILPAGAARPAVDFPRLAWTERDALWTGAASLPAAPAFVHIGEPSGSLARRARWLDIVALAATALAIGWTILYTARSADTREA